MSQAWIFLRCPSCKGKFKLPPSAQGKQAKCPHCEEKVGVPATEASEKTDNKSRKRKAREKRRESREKKAKEEPNYKTSLLPQAEAIPEPSLEDDEGGIIEEVIVLSKDGHEIQSIDFDEEGVEYIREELEDGTIQLRKRRRQTIPDWEKAGTVLGDDSKIKILTIAAATMLGVALVFVLVFSGRNNVETESPTKQSEMERLTARDQLELAIDATTNFLNARDWQERALYVRDAERVTPLMREFYTRYPEKDGPISFLKVGSRDYIEVHKRFVTIFFDRLDYDRDVVAVEVSEDGNFKIDWESFLGYSEMPWEDFVEKKVAKPTLFRVIAQRDNYYNNNFDHPLRWICYKLRFQNSDDVFWGYAKAHSDAHHGLMMNFGKSGLFTLRLKFPEDTKSDNQVIISETLQKGWVLR